MKIRRIVPNISSNKIDESKYFYMEFLGMQLVMDMEWVLTFASESNPTAQINIIKSDNPSNSNISISIEVADIDILYKKANSLGYEITYSIRDEPWVSGGFL